MGFFEGSPEALGALLLRLEPRDLLAQRTEEGRRGQGHRRRDDCLPLDDRGCAVAVTAREALAQPGAEADQDARDHPHLRSVVTRGFFLAIVELENMGA